MNWVHRDGAHAPHGPFETEAEARAYAMQELRRWPAATFDLLAVVDRLTSTASNEASWDSAEEFRPLTPEQLELLRMQRREMGLSTANSDLPFESHESLGFLREIMEHKNTPENFGSAEYPATPEHPLTTCLGAITGLLSGEEVPAEFPEQFTRLTRLQAALLAADPEQPLTLVCEDRHTLVSALSGLLPSLSTRAETVEEFIGLGLVARALEWAKTNGQQLPLEVQP